MDKNIDLNQFCAQQIHIPPHLPKILKHFTKAAIRTQPRCLLQWSSAYFRALAEGQEPPAKDRKEYSENEAISGLTMGILRVLNKQVSSRHVVLNAVRRHGIVMNFQDN